MPQQLSDILDTALEWDFEIFKLEEMTEKRPLVYLGMLVICFKQCLAILHKFQFQYMFFFSFSFSKGLELARRFDVFNTLSCDENTFKGWLVVIESHYHSNNTYHNSTHAADVMQVSFSISIIFLNY